MYARVCGRAQLTPWAPVVKHHTPVTGSDGGIVASAGQTIPRALCRFWEPQGLKRNPHTPLHDSYLRPFFLRKREYVGKVLYKKHKVGNFKKKTFDTFIHSHIHSLIQQILIQLNVYWLLDVFPCRQWYAGQCLITMSSPPKILAYSMCSPWPVTNNQCKCGSGKRCTQLTLSS